MVALLLLLNSPAQAGVACQDGQSHETLTAAVSDTSCEEITLSPGTYEGDFNVARKIAIVGQGPRGTYILSRGGPVMSLTKGARVALTGLTLASDTSVIDAKNSHLTLVSVTIAPLDGAREGLLHLFDTDAVVLHVSFHLASVDALAVDATSGKGHDMTFERVQFFGSLPAPEGLQSVYAVNYGVSCTDCTFGGAARPLELPPT